MSAPIMSVWRYNAPDFQYFSICILDEISYWKKSIAKHWIGIYASEAVEQKRSNNIGQ